MDILQNIIYYCFHKRKYLKKNLMLEKKKKYIYQNWEHSEMNLYNLHIFLQVSISEAANITANNHYF